MKKSYSSIHGAITLFYNLSGRGQNDNSVILVVIQLTATGAACLRGREAALVP